MKALGIFTLTILFLLPAISTANTCTPSINEKKVLVEVIDSTGKTIYTKKHKINKKKKYKNFVSVDPKVLDILRKDSNINVAKSKFASSGLTTKASNKNSNTLVKIGGCPMSEATFYTRIGKQKKAFVSNNVLDLAGNLTALTQDKNNSSKSAEKNKSTIPIVSSTKSSKKGKNQSMEIKEKRGVELLCNPEINEGKVHISLFDSKNRVIYSNEVVAKKTKTNKGGLYTSNETLRGLDPKENFNKIKNLEGSFKELYKDNMTKAWGSEFNLSYKNNDIVAKIGGCPVHNIKLISPKYKFDKIKESIDPNIYFKGIALSQKMNEVLQFSKIKYKEKAPLYKKLKNTQNLYKIGQENKSNSIILLSSEVNPKAATPQNLCHKKLNIYVEAPSNFDFTNNIETNKLIRDSKYEALTFCDNYPFKKKGASLKIVTKSSSNGLYDIPVTAEWSYVHRIQGKPLKEPRFTRIIKNIPYDTKVFKGEKLSNGQYAFKSSDTYSREQKFEYVLIGNKPYEKCQKLAILANDESKLKDDSLIKTIAALGFNTWKLNCDEHILRNKPTGEIHFFKNTNDIESVLDKPIVRVSYNAHKQKNYINLVSNPVLKTSKKAPVKTAIKNPSEDTMPYAKKVPLHEINLPKNSNVTKKVNDVWPFGIPLGHDFSLDMVNEVTNAFETYHSGVRLYWVNPKKPNSYFKKYTISTSNKDRLITSVKAEGVCINSNRICNEEAQTIYKSLQKIYGKNFKAVSKGTWQTFYKPDSKHEYQIKFSHYWEDKVSNIHITYTDWIAIAKYRERIGDTISDAAKDTTGF